MRADFPRSAGVQRERAQQRIAASRAAVAAAWADVEVATITLEARAHRVIEWARTLSLLAALLGGTIALRRLVARGGTLAALRTLAATTALRRVLPTALQLYLRHH